MQTNNKELFTIRELSKFGIGEHMLRKWNREGLLKPSAFCGKIMKFSKRNFDLACQASVNAEIDKANKLIHCIPKRKKHKPSSIYDEIEAKFLN